MLHRTIVPVLIAVAAMAPWNVARAAEYPLYPVLECYDEVSSTDVRMHFGVTNLLTTEVIADLNLFMVGDNAIPTPISYAPGYSPRKFSLTVSTTAGIVTWALGQSSYVLVVDPQSLNPDDQCSSEAGVPGPTGPEGPAGPTGPAGPAGESAGQMLGSCRLVTASLPAGRDYGVELTVTCDPDEALLQGGGSCDRGNLRGSFQVDAQSWKVVCRAPKGVQASALCCPTN